MVSIKYLLRNRVSNKFSTSTSLQEHMMSSKFSMKSLSALKNYFSRKLELQKFFETYPKKIGVQSFFFFQETLVSN